MKLEEYRPISSSNEEVKRDTKIRKKLKGTPIERECLVCSKKFKTFHNWTCPSCKNSLRDVYDFGYGY